MIYGNKILLFSGWCVTSECSVFLRGLLGAIKGYDNRLANEAPRIFLQRKARKGKDFTGFLLLKTYFKNNILDTTFPTFFCLIIKNIPPNLYYRLGDKEDKY